ncbi:MAG: hypothetical protein ACKOWZ_10350 [Sediminibacterium sp.]|jgi:hypothetical protein
MTKYDYVKVALIAIGLYLVTYTCHKDCGAKTSSNTAQVVTLVK